MRIEGREGDTTGSRDSINFGHAGLYFWFRWDNMRSISGRGESKRKVSHHSNTTWWESLINGSRSCFGWLQLSGQIDRSSGRLIGKSPVLNVLGCRKTLTWLFVSCHSELPPLSLLSGMIGIAEIGLWHCIFLSEGIIRSCGYIPFSEYYAFGRGGFRTSS